MSDDPETKVFSVIANQMLGIVSPRVRISVSYPVIRSSMGNLQASLSSEVLPMLNNSMSMSPLLLFVKHSDFRQICGNPTKHHKQRSMHMLKK